MVRVPRAPARPAQGDRLNLKDAVTLHDDIQVVVPGPLQSALRAWLESRGLYLFPIPVEDDLPTFGIGVQ